MLFNLYKIIYNTIILCGKYMAIIVHFSTQKSIIPHYYVINVIIIRFLMKEFDVKLNNFVKQMCLFAL